MARDKSDAIANWLLVALTLLLSAGAGAWLWLSR
jgi:hypothetical protein